MKKSFLVLYTIFFLLTAKLYGQQENTMYFMDRIVYASTLNPAMTPDCSFYLGGLAFPVVGQLPPSMYLGVSTPFSYGDIIYPGKGEYSDSLITPLFSPEDLDAFKSKLNDNNILSFETEFPTLAFGFRVKENFWTFSMTEKIKSNVILPKSFVLLPLEGNGAHMEADLSGLAFNTMAYREYALGYKQQVNKYLKVGFRFKFLNGYYNLYTEQSEIKLKTDAENARLVSEVNMTVNTSAPIDSVSHDEDGNVEDVHFGTPSAEDLMKTATFSGNWGVGLDFGVVKDFNSEISLYASIVDLGYFNWANNPNSFIFKGEQELKGIYVDSIDFADAVDDYEIDSLFSNYEYSSMGTAYTQWLPFKVYVGADYKIKKWFKMGLLYRGEYLFDHLYSAYTLSANFKYMKFSSTSISYTIKNNNYVNLGLGTSYRMGPFNMFFVSDNIGAALWWWKSELFAFRMGTTLTFGVSNKRKSRSSVPLLDLYH